MDESIFDEDFGAAFEDDHAFLPLDELMAAFEKGERWASE